MNDNNKNTQMTKIFISLSLLKNLRSHYSLSSHNSERLAIKKTIGILILPPPQSQPIQTLNEHKNH